MNGNEFTIQTGDVVRLSSGHLATVGEFDNTRGIYWTSRGLRFRHEFQPVKWEGDTLGNTGIGVCAKNGSEEAHG